MNLEDKTNFLLFEYTELLKTVDPDAIPLWGVLNFQGMIEHMSDTVKNANGKVHLPLITPEDKLVQFKAFAISDIPFKENTVNKLLPTDAPPLRFNSINESITELQEELNYLEAYFKEDATKTTLNPIFGEMNFAEIISLLYKHAWHHLRQFKVN